MSNSVVEEWRPVVGWEADYSVSNLGRVRRESPSRSRHSQPGRILNPHDGRGYRVVMLAVGARRRAYRVHRLVMAAFVGPIPPGLEVNHLDGDKANNRLENLEYTTRSANESHAYAIGLCAKGDRHYTRLFPHLVPRGEKNGNSRLTAEQVAEIRRRYALSKNRGQLAAEFGVSYSTVWKIGTNQGWTHLS